MSRRSAYNVTNGSKKGTAGTQASRRVECHAPGPQVLSSTTSIMKTTYLLPCQCGEKLQVDASESGLIMKCGCGASLEVPTMRGLAQLERVTVEESAAPSRGWGGAQRSMAIGALIAILG